MTFYNDNLDEDKIAEIEIKLDVGQFGKFQYFSTEIVSLYLK